MFPHQPDALALLTARLGWGWRPQPSPMADGMKVLGYAACLEAGDCR